MPLSGAFIILKFRGEYRFLEKKVQEKNLYIFYAREEKGEKNRLVDAATRIAYQARSDLPDQL